MRIKIKLEETFYGEESVILSKNLNRSVPRKIQTVQLCGKFENFQG